MYANQLYNNGIIIFKLNGHVLDVLAISRFNFMQMRADLNNLPHFKYHLGLLMGVYLLVHPSSAGPATCR